MLGTNTSPAIVRPAGSRNRRRMRGFSVLELLIVVVVVLISATMTFITVKSVTTTSDSSNAYDMVLMALRQARDSAVAERRMYKVQFSTPGTGNGCVKSTDNCVVVTVTETGQASVTTLPTDTAFDAEAGIPNTATTTPDQFGLGQSTGAIDLDVNNGGGGSIIFFNPDGSCRDNNGALDNGVVYIAHPGDIQSSRAITVWGATGRVRGYKLVKNQTSGTYSWVMQ